jgi:predicted Fe-S protein YdhL (DUF1289 family)
VKSGKINACKTPCIGVCSTGIGDTVCRGCKRFSHEVIAWNSYTQDERRAVLQRIDVLLGQIVARWLVIDDIGQLRRQLKLQQINFDENRYPASWVVELLKAGASQIEDQYCSGLLYVSGRKEKIFVSCVMPSRKNFMNCRAGITSAISSMLRCSPE